MNDYSINESFVIGKQMEKINFFLMKTEKFTRTNEQKQIISKNVDNIAQTKKQEKEKKKSHFLHTCVM